MPEGLVEPGEGSIHRNPATGHHPGTNAPIQSVECNCKCIRNWPLLIGAFQDYLHVLLPMGGRSGEEKLRKYRQATVNDLNSQQASKQMHELPLLS